MLYFVVFVLGIISGLIISFMVEENRKIQRLKNPKTYTLDEIKSELGLTDELTDEAAFELGCTKAQMELKDAYKPKTGKWEVCDILDYAQRPSGRKVLRCPFCGYLTGEFRSVVDYYHKLTNFCPNCGARMEESE